MDICVSEIPVEPALLSVSSLAISSVITFSIYDIILRMMRSNPSASYVKGRVVQLWAFRVTAGIIISGLLRLKRKGPRKGSQTSQESDITTINQWWEPRESAADARTSFQGKGRELALDMSRERRMPPVRSTTFWLSRQTAMALYSKPIAFNAIVVVGMN
jgi:hypothetical protein